MRLLIVAIIALIVLSGCRQDYSTVEKVELEKFMGDWYVIGILPNAIEKHAVNGIESYRLNEDGTIGITYTFKKGTPDGKEKILTPKAKVFNHETNAEWRVQMFKPFWYPYLVVDLADDYRYTVIGVPNRKYVWIMSRTPDLAENDYQNILAKLKHEGYNTEKIVKMPQIW
ncbi:MAG: lipocalin family protein [Candidatus Cloacimonetes bacterium]|nr:lipocalin family protein [Candidatus Cloacimonadota bacterium]